MSKPQDGTPMAASDRENLAVLVSKVGERKALQLLGISRGTLARAMSGLGVRGVTSAAIRAGLRQWAANT